MKNSKYDSLYEDIKSGSNIISDDEFKNILHGVSQVASDMVVKTLGPGGKTTLLDDGTFVYPTKDGYTWGHVRWSYQCSTSCICDR